MKTGKIIFILLVPILFILFTLNSCRTDEFKFNDIKIKDGWALQVVVPLLSGDFEFKDLVFDWSEPLNDVSKEKTSLVFSSDSALAFPSALLFQPAVIIDSLVFLINGDDYLESASMKYIVENGASLPLNLQLRFFNSQNPNDKGPAFLPPAFNAATDLNSPHTTIHEQPLTPEQLSSFRRANRIEISTWFNQPEKGIATSYPARAPIKISVVFMGTIQNDYVQ